MRKMMLVAMLLLLLVGSVHSAFAQDEESEASGLPQCTPEELAAVQEALTTEFETFAGMGMLEAGVDYASVSELVAGYDELSANFWNSVYTEFPQCAEAFYLGYGTGQVFDEALRAVLMQWQALFEEEYGDPDAAAAFAESAARRTESVNGVVANFGDVMGAFVELANLPACTEEESEAFYAVLEEAGAVMEGIEELSAESTLEDLDELIVMLDEATVAWDETMGELTLCGDIIPDALNASTILSETLTIVSMYRVAAMEGEHGDPDLAAEILSRADSRLEALQATVEAMAEEEE